MQFIYRCSLCTACHNLCSEKEGVKRYWNGCGRRVHAAVSVVWAACSGTDWWTECHYLPMRLWVESPLPTISFHENWYPTNFTCSVCTGEGEKTWFLGLETSGPWFGTEHGWGQFQRCICNGLPPERWQAIGEKQIIDKWCEGLPARKLFISWWYVEANQCGESLCRNADVKLPHLLWWTHRRIEAVKPLHFLPSSVKLN